MEVFVARQPIFDRSGDVVGYELLYRRSAQSRFADGSDSSQMSRDVVIQSFLEVGLDKITRGKTGFINFGREMLLEGAYELLDPDVVVIELLEDVLNDPEVTSACERLVAAGYRLALDDFVAGSHQEELLSFAGIIKLDVLNRTPEEIREMVGPLKRRTGLRLLAERVETSEVHEECKQLGFDLFQGYFYSRPEILANRGVSVEHAAIIRLMNLLGSDGATDEDVEEGFRRDASLSYKLLRMLSTAAMGGRGIESIRYAIRLLGRATLQRWLSLLLASSFAAEGGTDVELVHTAVVRARFTELLGVRSGRAVSSDGLFLVGLFSLMDSLMRAPMTEVVARVDLAPPVRDALLQRDGPYADFLRLVEAYESGDWEEVTAIAPRMSLSPLDVPEIYLQALTWSREQVS
ncbi:MAG: EAL domain-containing protein, partial [Gemmatimonadota bacterium]